MEAEQQLYQPICTADHGAGTGFGRILQDAGAWIKKTAENRRPIKVSTGGPPPAHHKLNINPSGSEING